VTVKVGIAADDELTLLRAITALEQDGVDVILTAETVDAVASPDAVESLDAAVLALSKGQLAGAVQAFRHTHPELPLVVIGPPEGWPGIRRALERGVDGLLANTEIEARLAVTVRAVCAGYAAVPRPDRSSIDADTLSAREKQVLGMVVMGFSNGEIARTLHLAESTIKSHLSAAFSKLGVASRKEAAALILDPHDGLGPAVLAIST
jgi:two-component system, NarL family, response regulator DesR